MKANTLYKKTSTGAIQFWDISAEDVNGEGVITTTHGQVGTDSPQTTVDVIREGKNIGKVNETTPYEQAISEAAAKWQKQKKKRYVETIEEAEAGTVDAKAIKGGADPMLAHKYADHAHKITFPCHGQPKLDGIRCIAMIVDGECTLWTRTRKQINCLPHIVDYLEDWANGRTITLDGELYNHDYKDRFSEIVSMVRQKDKVHPDHEQVQYHVYDQVDLNKTFVKRLSELWDLIGPVKLVETLEINNEGWVGEALSMYLKAGYEGLMLRNSESKYKGKRSYDLQKVKTFDDAEFEIVGIEEGRGNLMGHVGAFVCKTADGTEFKAKMSGERDMLKQYFDNHAWWEGKQLTVQYQGMTDKNSVPRFPVGIAIRDYD